MFNQISSDEFIARRWQQQPMVLRQSFSDLVGIISGDELAGLACEEVVESRLISGFDLLGTWQCRHGPFGADDFATLPGTNWTLLVQCVDQWRDSIRAILDRFKFLPRWRLDDIMASYAPVGGGVGPHFDYYDVFLIQVQGRREWQLGQHCDETTGLQDNDQLKLLTDFDTQVTHIVESGDALYIPAGMAHWGRALSDNCITLSVGFRAPSEQEIISETLEIALDGLSANKRYRDTADSIDPHPDKINLHAMTNLAAMLGKLTPAQLHQFALQAFGQLVTEPRSFYPDEVEPHWTAAKLHERLKSPAPVLLTRAPQTRLAFTDTLLFVNGRTYPCDEAFCRALCDGKIYGPVSRDQLDLLVDLLNEGSLLIDS